MRKKIFQTMAILLIVTLAFCGITMSFAMSENAKHNAEQRLLETARTTLLMLPTQQAANAAQWQQQVAAIIANTAGTHYRLTVIAADGKVVADNYTAAAKLPNHSDREEFRAAQTNGQGLSIHHSDSLMTDFLYAAVASPDRNFVVRVALPFDDVRQTQQSIMLWLLGICLIALLFTLLLSNLLTKRLVKPLHRLQQETERIALGDVSGSISVVQGNDEISELTNSVNAMTNLMENMINWEKSQKALLNSILQSVSTGVLAVDKQERLLFVNGTAAEYFHINSTAHRPLRELTRQPLLLEIIKETREQKQGIQREVTSGMVMELKTSPILSSTGEVEGVVVAVQDLTHLRHLEKLRAEFVANATHELKTPLTSIRGYTETLRNGTISDPQVIAEVLEIIDIQGERLLNLINDMLALSEIENQQVEREGNCDLVRVVAEVVQALQPLANKQQITLTCTMPEELPVAANYERMHRLILNLVSNAIRYNNDGGSVDIRLQREEGLVRLSVADTGIGIAPEFQQKIFERFYRVDKGRSRDTGGTGLGLAIVKHLVRLYDGKLTVTSKLGEGSTFSITLPL